MNKHFIYLIGLIILIITVWLTTMAGINITNKKEDENEINIYFTIQSNFTTKQLENNIEYYCIF